MTETVSPVHGVLFTKRLAPFLPPHTSLPHLPPTPPPTTPPTPTHTLGGSFTVNLYTQHHPYGSSTASVFDPNLGRHDYFAVVGPYIFAQVWTGL